MYVENRLSEDYIDGVSTFRRAAEQDMLKKEIKLMYSICIDCNNLKIFTNPAQIERHLIRRGFKKEYTCWTSHGEEQIILEGSNIIEGDNDMPDVDCAFDEGRSHDDNLDHIIHHAEGDYSEKEFARFEGLMEDSGKPLFPGYKPEYTRLSSVLELLKSKASNG